MLIASKYEEMYAPEVSDFVYITDNAYTKKDILEMEGIILHALNFSFGKPLCLHFLRRNSKAGQVWKKDFHCSTCRNARKPFRYLEFLPVSDTNWPVLSQKTRTLKFWI